MDRRDVASWLQGPREALEDQGYEFGYRGERLGLPEAGPGSISRFGRRLVALLIDWIASLLVARLLFGGNNGDTGLETLGVFAVMTIVLVSFGGSSFGHRIMGLRVVAVANRGPLSPLRVILRTVLLCLVIPPLVWDRDGRGLHDRAADSVILRTR